MKKEILTEMRDGFLFNINNSMENINFLDAKDIVYSSLDDRDNYCLSFTNVIKECINTDSVLLKYGVLENFDEKRFEVEIIKRENYDYLKKLLEIL